MHVIFKLAEAVCTGTPVNSFMQGVSWVMPTGFMRLYVCIIHNDVIGFVVCRVLQRSLHLHLLTCPVVLEQKVPALLSPGSQLLKTKNYLFNKKVHKC